MSKNLILLLAGIITAWLVLSFFTNDFDWNFLIILSLGVFLGYEVGKKEIKD